MAKKSGVSRRVKDAKVPPLEIPETCVQKEKSPNSVLITQMPPAGGSEDLRGLGEERTEES